MQNNDNHDTSKMNHLFLSILSSYVNGKTNNYTFTREECIYLASLAYKQGLGSIFYKAVESIKCFDEEALYKLSEYYNKSLFMCAARNESLFRISSAFENFGVDFIILKGAVFQNYYPSPELRVMSDIDFLIKDEYRNKVKEILVSLGINFIEENSYQDIYKDCNGIIIEVHHALWGYGLEKTTLYSKLWSSVNQAKNSNHTFVMSDNDKYIFLITHMYKHFCCSGVGLRPLFDIWFFLQEKENLLDFSYIRSELSVLGEELFERKILELVKCIFLDKEKNDDLKLIEDYLFRCNTHGTTKISVASSMVKTSKTKHFFIRIFPPYSFMVRRYDILKKFPILLPFFWIFRIVVFPFNKRSLKNNVNKLKSISEDESLYVQKVFKAAGIDTYKL